MSINSVEADFKVHATFTAKDDDGNDTEINDTFSLVDTVIVYGYVDGDKVAEAANEDDSFLEALDAAIEETYGTVTGLKFDIEVERILDVQKDGPDGRD